MLIAQNSSVLQPKNDEILYYISSFIISENLTLVYFSVVLLASLHFDLCMNIFSPEDYLPFCLICFFVQCTLMPSRINVSSLFFIFFSLLYFKLLWKFVSEDFANWKSINEFVIVSACLMKSNITIGICKQDAIEF